MCYSKSQPKPLVAVVEDDNSVRKALDRLLHALGMEVETFASAQDFFQNQNSQHPDCLLLDAHLPDLSGLQVQSRLTRLDPGLPIVFISGAETPAERADALKRGAVAFLHKPFAEQELVAAIVSALKSTPLKTEQSTPRPTTGQD